MNIAYLFCFITLLLNVFCNANPDVERLIEATAKYRSSGALGQADKEGQLEAVALISNDQYRFLLSTIFLAAAVTFISTLCVPAPYGKQERDGWGPGVNMRFGWFILELPAFVGMLVTYLQGEHALEVAPLILASLFLMHYFHRTFVYPLTIRSKPDAKYRIILLLLGMAFNAANGILNGHFLSNYAPHLYDSAWLTDPRFIGGLSLFISGFALNKHSDAILRNLRAPSETGYKIPHGGAFNLVSCPNYLGEIMQWCGFALAGWSAPGLAFAAFTAANLVPKALSSHRWYRNYFPNYPVGRAAIVPGIL